MRGETILGACASLDIPVESLAGANCQAWAVRESPARPHLRRGVDFLDQIESGAKAD